VHRKWFMAVILVVAGAVWVIPTALNTNPANAAEVTVLSAVAVKSALDDLAANFERGTGDKLTISYATAGEIIRRIRGGESADVTILPTPRSDELVQEGKYLSEVRPISHAPPSAWPCVPAHRNQI
jgi:ABC-type molybdate transport system substrate-binding protein